ncbi:MAG TPA: hypothetical protein VLI39_03020 [Sedimentisphaerales bacterium]|nr:hypothetical protein [Sedimentisphaerales bacterium]
MTNRRPPPSSLIVPAGTSMTLLPLYCTLCRRSFEVIVRGCVHRVKDRFWLIRPEETVPLPTQRCPWCAATEIYLISSC